MRRIVILRHATAAPQGREPGDRARPLSERGRQEMASVRKWVAAEDVRFDRIVCSSAERTRETAALLETTAAIEYSDALYLGSPETYLAEAEGSETDTVLLVGHNPTCAALVGSFERNGCGFADGYPPASICLAERNGNGWRIAKLRLGRSAVDD